MLKTWSNAQTILIVFVKYYVTFIVLLNCSKLWPFNVNFQFCERNNRILRNAFCVLCTV